ncbi:class I SAM-dependent methyltransferase [Haloterrigena alkaliphila]|uniref:class I SAM-dependent methyltransferase n=1 Tax=Haloterrigena alkaliphila TaxID=2816475 RepID=UPI001CFF9E31|nr:class I SAM-dependent methyltransferase [Haloterrigena alkaliphila]UHQ95133.1 class I SAM-dependent methyltransferase [Haloterrigena alkaliphila]
MDAERFQNTGQPDWDWWGRLWPTPAATLRRLGVTPGRTVAEVACGNGYFALPAARITDPNPVYALDLEESLLEECTRLAERQEIENVVPIHGDARRLSQLLPERVDVVLVANTFHGVDDKRAFVEEAAESLRPGGRFVVVNWHDRPRETTTVAGEPRGPPTDLRLSPDDAAAAVLECETFSLEERIELPPYHYGLLFERTTSESTAGDR